MGCASSSPTPRLMRLEMKYVDPFCVQIGTHKVSVRSFCGLWGSIVNCRKLTFVVHLFIVIILSNVISCRSNFDLYIVNANIFNLVFLI